MIANVVFEAVLCPTETGDVEVEECKTLASARKTIKKMIGDKPYYDAYIRRFAYDEYGDTISVEDYDIEYGPKTR